MKTGDQLTIDVWDGKEWRRFTVVPHDRNFKPRCENGIHQFRPEWARCACGAMNRDTECTTG